MLWRRQFRRASIARSIAASPALTCRTNVTPHEQANRHAGAGQRRLGGIADELTVLAVQADELLNVLGDGRHEEEPSTRAPAGPRSAS